ncbi:MAG: hypothetical protein LQ340_000477 [Diploschistes diacapsis]|nr:MAG: hypothetical protein LQ340_000477 [Diploschistes diacapsis]
MAFRPTDMAESHIYPRSYLFLLLCLSNTKTDLPLPIVKVGLHSQDGDLSRSYVLDRNQPNVTIGRASKSGEARLQAQPDNGWIESPILSREHAAVVMGDSQSKPLLIRDSGSTHGTFVDDKRLTAHKDYPLKNLDKVVFGIPVTSGRSTLTNPSPRLTIAHNDREIRTQDLHDRVQVREGEVGMAQMSHVHDAHINSAECQHNDTSQAVDQQPSTFRVPSPSDSEDETEARNVASAHEKRELSLELVSSGRVHHRSGSEDVILVSPSKTLERTGNKNKTHIDLTGLDSPDLPAIRSKEPNALPRSVEPKQVTACDSDSEGPEVQKIAKKPLQSSSTYLLDYDDAIDQDAVGESGDEFDNHVPAKDPASVPDDLDLIEGLLDHENRNQDHEQETSPPKSDDNGTDEDVDPQDTPASQPSPLPANAYSEGPFAFQDEEDEESDMTSQSSDHNDSLVEDNEDSPQDPKRLQAYAVNTGDSAKPAVRDLAHDGTVSAYEISSENMDISSDIEEDKGESDEDDINSLMLISDSHDSFDSSEDGSDADMDDIVADSKSDEAVSKDVQHGAEGISAAAPEHYLSVFESAALRPPSPSDAAMPKSNMSVVPGLNNRREQYVPPTSAQNVWSAGEYYSARQQNGFRNTQRYNDMPCFPKPHPYSGFYYPGLQNQVQHPWQRQSQFNTSAATMPQTCPPNLYYNSYNGYRTLDMNVGMAANPPMCSQPDVEPEPAVKPSRVQISDLVDGLSATESGCCPEPDFRIEDMQPSMEAEKDILPDQSDEQAAATPIPQSHLARTPKRKAAEMEGSLGRTQVEVGLEREPESITPEKTQISSIPDAQPQDTVTHIPELVQDTLLPLDSSTLVHDTASDTKRSVSSRANAVANILGSFSLTSIREEPARKKLKIMPKTVPKRNIKANQAFKTFVSGCIAGAVTVVGAAAALIATMPASVQEDALRSM